MTELMSGKVLGREVLELVSYWPELHEQYHEVLTSDEGNQETTACLAAWTVFVAHGNGAFDIDEGLLDVYLRYAAVLDRRINDAADYASRLLFGEHMSHAARAAFRERVHEETRTDRAITAYRELLDQYGTGNAA